MILKQKLTKKQMELLMGMNAIIPAHETYAYYRLPWAKIEMGSNKAEFYPNENDYPEDLKKVLDGEKKYTPEELQELKDLYNGFLPKEELEKVDNPFKL